MSPANNPIPVACAVPQNQFPASYYHVNYKALRVSYLPELEGGGMTFGQQYLQVVRERLGPVDHVFEFCAGPGFIGFSLLAHSLCKKLTLADINPAAVAACCATIRDNHLEDRVTVYESDGLDGIPETEKWDLVVSNPPHWPGDEAAYRRNIRRVDPGFVIHQKFYRDVRKHLKPGAAVIFQENGRATRKEEFLPLIEQNGLELVDVFVAGQEPRRGTGTRRSARGFALFHRLMGPVERFLLIPGVERFLKDNNAYRRLQKLQLLMPSPFYFIWSRPAGDRPQRQPPG
jgi:SAM-dependent methyltransferase